LPSLRARLHIVQMSTGTGITRQVFAGSAPLERTNALREL
jgi:hypothetical protein